MVFGGGARRPRNVILFNAVMYNSALGDHLEKLKDIFGEIIDQTDHFSFDHTDYYNKEFGEDLRKFFVLHRLFIQPDRIVEMKLKAIQLEEQYKKEGRRTINIDPGYVAIEKVVAASTKNFTHRIYMGKGIYADLQLSRRGNRYEPHSWTFEDYKKKDVLELFERARKLLMEGAL
ncbi:MAG: DUF4416 family protein [Calditerrivibrio sp.]|nr:DUF4416 family protein [Calditerrivibrio sp.]